MSKFVKIIAVVAFFVGAVAFVLPKLHAQTAASLKYNSKKHSLYKPVVKTVEEPLTLAGSIDTDQMAALRFQNSGRLVWVGVKVGDRVRRGQAIASLDKWELKKNLETQFNNYRKSLSEFHDTKDKYKDYEGSGILTDTVKRILDRTQYSLDNSVITYEITDMAIKEATIYSPLNGVVVGVDQPLAGANITPATATFTIVNPESLYFKSEIDQEAVTRIKVGAPVKISLDSFTDSTIDSKVTYIAFSPVSGQTSTVYEIRFELPVKNADMTYRLGMDGDADLILAKSDNALAVRSESVYDDNGQKYVYVLSDKELVRRDIKIGIETETDVEVKEGLSENDQVAVIQN